MRWLLLRASGMIFWPRREWKVVAGEQDFQKPVIFLVMELVFCGAIVFLVMLLTGKNLAEAGTLAQNAVSYIFDVILADMSRPSTLTLLQRGLVIALTSALIGGAAIIDAVLVSAFSPAFGGKRDLGAALKLVAYSASPFYFLGFLSFHPALRLLALALSVYSFVILWVGMPDVMQCRPDKRPVYFIVTVLVVLITYALVLATGPLLQLALLASV